MKQEKAFYEVSLKRKFQTIMDNVSAIKMEQVTQARFLLKEKNFDELCSLGHKIKGTFLIQQFIEIGKAIENFASEKNEKALSKEIDVLQDFLSNISIRYD